MTPALVTPGYRVEQALRARGVPLNDQTAAMVRILVDMGPFFGTGGETLRRIGIPDSTAYWRLRKKNLPGLRCWHILGRALYVARAVQGAESQSLREVAKGLGYRDHSGVSVLLRDAFGFGATEIRRARPTVETLIEGWLDREGAWR